jgi:amino-acid N-acetyltransferase
MIREAKPSDVEQIYELMKPYTISGDLLPRTKDDILDHIRNFFVYEVDDKIVGCVSIKYYSKEMAELRSLVVDKNLQSKGIGSEIVKYAVNTLKTMGIKKVFVLTKAERFFKKLGFKTVKKEIFPEKIWFDCMFCPKLNNCDEIPMLFHTNDESNI